MHTPEGHIALPGSERPPAPGSTLIAPLEGTEKLTFTLLLRQRPEYPEPHGLEHWQKTEVRKRQFLTVDDYTRKYGTTQEDMDTVLDYLKSKGLHIIESDSGRNRMVIEGTAAKINSAFSITLNLYSVPHPFIKRPQHQESPRNKEKHIYRGFEGSIHIPTALTEIVRAIIGLDNRQLGGPAGIGSGDPTNAKYLSPEAVAQLYNFPNTGAVGQTIGLFESAAGGAAYLQSDIIDFISSLPAGYNTPPITHDIGLTVGGTTYGNKTSLVSSSPTPGVLECTLDVAAAAAVAQGSTINVYFTEDSEAGWDAFFSRAIFPLPGDKAPSVLSASWVLALSDDAGSIGNPAASGSIANVLSGYLKSAAMRGITVLIAIGDWGAGNQIVDSNCHVSYPSSDPWVTACGGTIIGDVSQTPSISFEEWTWSDANTTSQFQGGVYNATGGGVSDTFPVPPYQSSVGVTPISKNDGKSRRGVPDVAGMVAMDGFFFKGVGGPGQNQLFGTSAVAPLYAGLVAVINAYLGHSVGFLNPLFYTKGPEICNDIRIGNNDSGYTPDATFYTSRIGWDACTGWGSINGRRLLAALLPAPIMTTVMADKGSFGHVCLGSFTDETLTINNSGFSLLLISNITSSSSEFVVPHISSYPLAIEPGGFLNLPIRFQPVSLGAKTALLEILNNDISGLHGVLVSGLVAAPKLSIAMADKGNFGRVCLGAFNDEPLVLSNSGSCSLSISNITSSSSNFIIPEVLKYPITIGAGDAVELPVRFQPLAFGEKSATLSIVSNDPEGPAVLHVHGDAPAGKLVVTGSTYFGAVNACSREERTLSICNAGDCTLNVSSVAFNRKSRHWKLLNNPFPEKLHPGSCLNVVVSYKATEKCSRSCDLVIVSDDPTSPIKTVEIIAYTVWNESCCPKCCDDCCRGKCEKQHCTTSCCKNCCDDRDEDDELE